MSTVSESEIWNRIDEAEQCFVRGTYEEAASMASAVVRTIRSCKFEGPLGDAELADMMSSAGMVIFHSYQGLGRTKELFVELKEIYGSIWAIPVQVLIASANAIVAEGFGAELKEAMEEYLSMWEYMIDAGVYVLREPETEESSCKILENDNIKRYCLSCASYLAVAEVYTVKLLGTALHRTDVAKSWVEAANLPQDGRQALLRTLESLQESQNQREAQKAAAPIISPTSSKDLHETRNDHSKGDNERQDFSPKLIRKPIQRGADRLRPFLWWFRSTRLKIGRFQFVVPSGKLMLFFSLFFWLTFLLRKRGGVFNNLAKKQINSLKQAAFDALRLAFSVQMNPLAAVQQVPALPRVS